MKLIKFVTNLLILSAVPGVLTSVDMASKERSMPASLHLASIDTNKSDSSQTHHSGCGCAICKTCTTVDQTSV